MGEETREEVKEEVREETREEEGEEVREDVGEEERANCPQRYSCFSSSPTHLNTTTTNQNTAGSRGVGPDGNSSLKDKHKILHRLLQQNSWASRELGGGGPRLKDNALLRYLLDRDDQDRGDKMEGMKEEEEETYCRL